MKFLAKFLSNIQRLIEMYIYVPDVSNNPGILGAPMQKFNDTVEVQRLQTQRKAFAEAVIKNLPTEKMSFCSIAAGFGAEEYLLKDSFKSIVLMEPSAYCYNFLTKTYGTGVTLCPEPLERADFDCKFDFIYTSGPTNWMQRHPAEGIPASFIKFLDENLESNGIFYARLYGGLHENKVVRSNYFYQRLIQTLGPKYLIQTAYYSEEYHQARVVITRSTYQPNEAFEKFIYALDQKEGVPRVLKNVLLTKDAFNFGKLFIVFLALLAHVPLQIVRKLLKLLVAIWRDIYTNFRLAR